MPTNWNHNLIPASWSRGREDKRGNMRTNGRGLWSYDLLIGITDDLGQKILFDYRGAVSVTTSRHVGGAIKYADVMVTPQEARAKGVIK